MLRRGEVRLNGSRAKADSRVVAGDEVRLPPVYTEVAGSAPVIAPTAIEKLERRIIHEDDKLLIIDKPSGLAVHSGSGVSYGVIDILRASRGPRVRLELAHRLDRETSGCLLLAKDMAVLRSLNEHLRAGAVRKGYLALLRGRLPQRLLNIDEPLRRGQGQGGDRRVVIDAEGKAAATRIQRRRQFAQATLVDVNLLTGRTHQIRVHAATAGHPLAGDNKYGDKAFNRHLRELGLRRLFLHAASLSLPEYKQAFQAPLPSDLQDLLDLLG